MLSSEFDRSACLRLCHSNRLLVGQTETALSSWKKNSSAKQCFFRQHTFIYKYISAASRSISSNENFSSCSLINKWKVYGGRSGWRTVRVGGSVEDSKWFLTSHFMQDEWMALICLLPQKKRKRIERTLQTKRLLIRTRREAHSF